MVPECSSGQTVISQSCTECAHCGDVATASSSSSGQVVTSSSSSGGTELCVDRASRVIALKLCVRDGKLEGVLHQGGVFDKAVITSQNVVSENEVVVDLQDKKGKTAKLTLQLLGERQLRGTFDNGQIFNARKLNSFRACLAPGHKEKPLFGNGNDENDDGKDSDKPHEPKWPKNGHPFGMGGWHG